MPRAHRSKRKLGIRDFEKNILCSGCYEIWCILSNRRLWLIEDREGRSHIMPRDWNPAKKHELKQSHSEDCKFRKRLKGRTHI